jgi:phosphohistidine swiveling domain-containing protein
MIDLNDLQQELYELAQDGRSDVEMRSAIVMSQFGHLVSHMTHDQILNPTARPYGSPAGELNDAGHFLLQAMTYVALRDINIELAIETALQAIRDRDFQKAELKDSQGQIAYPGPCTGIALVIPDLNSCKSLQLPRNKSTILVTSHPMSGLAMYAKDLMGIITDEGGIACHAAIIAREFKVPCIVGTHNSTKLIRTGDLVTIHENGIIEVKQI